MNSNIALLGPVIIPFIIALILFTSAGKDNKPKLFLATAMLNASFVFLGNYLYFTHSYQTYSNIHAIHIASVLLIYPSIYCYIILLIKPKIVWKNLVVHFLPAIVFMILSGLIFFLFLNIEQRIYFLGEYRLNPNFNNIWLEILWVTRFVNVIVLFLQIILYSILIFRLQKKHSVNVQEFFSNPWNVNLNWMKILNITFVSSAFICVFFYSINPVKLFGDERYLIYPFYLLSIIISIIGILGNNQDIILIEENTEFIDTNINTDKNLLKRQLEEYFSRKKPFLDPELKIWDICSELNSNRTYISSCINQCYNLNFNQFVNRYRVDYAKKLIQEHPSKTFEDIAYLSGFGSIASLSRAFKYFENRSPKEIKELIA